MAVANPLCLFVACHETVLAVDVRGVERLVLPEEITTLNVGLAPVVQVGRRRYMPFNLGRLLGLPPTSGASILVRTLYAGAELCFSLETGPCLIVRPQEAVTLLPEALFRVRRRALSGAFMVPAGLRTRGHAPVGFVLNLDELLVATERDAAAKAQASVPLEVMSSP